MNIANPLTLGDLVLVPGHYPAKLLKALAVIADRLHAEYAAESWIVSPDKSKESCVLASLTVRDFLLGVGFKAEVRSVTVVMNAIDAAGQELHSAGIGAPDRFFARRHVLDQPGRWNGHLVVTLPRERVLIDTTLFPIKERPAWADLLTGMMAVPLGPGGKIERLYGLPIITGCTVTEDTDGRQLTIAWLDRRNVSWRKGGDSKPDRRRRVVGTLIEKFGTWQDDSVTRLRA
jgi:hypothetical protein